VYSKELPVAINDNLNKWRAGLRATFPLVGELRRKSAIRTLEIHRNDPNVVPLLIEAMELEDEATAKRAATALAGLTAQPAIDVLCAQWLQCRYQRLGHIIVWLRARHERLGEIIVQRRYVASAPVQVRVLSGLKAGACDILNQADAEPIAHLVAAMDLDDPVIKQNAEAVLQSLRNPKGIDAVCALWAQQRDERLGEIIAQRHYVATAPVQVRVLSGLKAGACDALGQADAEPIAHLVTAMDDKDPVIQQNALAVLHTLQNPKGVDAFCALWPQDPHERLGRIIARQNYIEQVSLDQEIVFLIVVGLLNDPDETVRTWAARSLEQLVPGPAQDTLCDEAIKAPKGEAAKFCVRTGKRPRDHERACLFLFVTRQLDEYFKEDFEFQNLRLQYDRADDAVRAHVMEVVRSGDRRYTGFFGTGSKSLSDCTEKEVQVAVTSWLRHHDWERVFAAALELPLKHSLPLWCGLASSGWLPPEPAARGILKDVLETAEPLGLSVAGRDSEALKRLQGLVDVARPPGPARQHNLPAEQGWGYWHAEFTPDGNRLLTSNSMGFHVWDTTAGASIIQPLVCQQGKYEGGLQCIFDKEGHRVLAWDSHEARVWNALTGAPITPPLRVDAKVNRAAFSPDGTRIVTAHGRGGRSDACVCIWDAQSGQPVHAPIKHAAFVYHVAFSPDGRRLLTVAGADGEDAHLWECDTWLPIGRGMPHSVGDRPVFSHDGKRLLTNRGMTLYLWDVESGEPVGHACEGHFGRECIALHDDCYGGEFSANGIYVLASSSRAARVWESATGRLLTAIEHSGPGGDHLHTALFVPGGARVLTKFSSEVIKICDAASGLPVAPPIEQEYMFHVITSPDGRYIVTWSVSDCDVWCAETCKRVGQRLDHDKEIRQVLFAPDSRSLLTVTKEGIARLWDAATCRQLLPAIECRTEKGDAIFSPDGRKVLLLSRDGEVLWDIHLVRLSEYWPVHALPPDLDLLKSLRSGDLAADAQAAVRMLYSIVAWRVNTPEMERLVVEPDEFAGAFELTQ
jgi:WD40 repeat protein